MTWDEICEHPDLCDLPFRFGSNRRGHVVLLPMHNALGLTQGRIFDLLKERMPSGRCRHTTNIITRDGTKVADNAWASGEFLRVHRGQSTYQRAPEIVVVAKSPMNPMPELLEKRELFLEAGAGEVWVCGESGEMQFNGPNGSLERSALCPEFPVRVVVD